MAIPSSIDTLCINTIRTLSMDAVQQANSGHPGTPMALAPVVYTLWQRFLRFDDYERLGEISRGSSSPPTVCARLRLITPGDG